MTNFVSRRVGGGVALLFLLMLSVPMTGGARAESPSFLALGAGYYDPFKGSGPAGELRVEYRDGTRFWLFKPFIGTTFTTDPAFLGYAGVLSDFYFGKRVVISPSIAVGGYGQLAGKNMGTTFQIRSGLEVAYRFDNKVRLGLMLYHFSNAGIGNGANPGSEAISLTYSIPLY